MQARVNWKESKLRRSSDALWPNVLCGELDSFHGLKLRLSASEMNWFQERLTMQTGHHNKTTQATWLHLQSKSRLWFLYETNDKTEVNSWNYESYEEMPFFFWSDAWDEICPNHKHVLNEGSQWRQGKRDGSSENLTAASRQKSPSLWGLNDLSVISFLKSWMIHRVNTRNPV